MALNIAPATLPSIGRYAKEIQETKDVINRQRVVLVQLVIYFVWNYIVVSWYIANFISK